MILAFALVGWVFAGVVLWLAGRNSAAQFAAHERALDRRDLAIESLIAQIQANSQGAAFVPPSVWNGPEESEAPKRTLTDDTGLVYFEDELDEVST